MISPDDDRPLTEEEVRLEVEKMAAHPFFACENQEFMGSLRLVLAGILLGTSNADRLARFLGLNRDKFVRPRAKRLRESGIFLEGTIGQPGAVAVDEDVLESDDEGMLMTWLTVSALVAEGLVIRSEEVPCPT